MIIFFSITQIFIPPCFDILDEIESNSRQYCKIIYDNYSDIEDVDYYLKKIQITYENERHFNLEIILTNHHSKTENYLHDFTIRENIPIYDSYHDQASIHIDNHNSLSNSQVEIRNYSNSIILTNSCEKNYFKTIPIVL